MSFRNGDKSREHRLRKAREQKRKTIREVVSKKTTESAAQPAQQAPAK